MKRRPKAAAPAPNPGSLPPRLIETLLRETQRLIAFHRACVVLDDALVPDDSSEVAIIYSNVCKDSWLQKNVAVFWPLYHLPEARFELVYRYWPRGMICRRQQLQETIKDARNKVEDYTTVGTFAHVFQNAVYAAQTAIQELIKLHEEFELDLCKSMPGLAAANTHATATSTRDNTQFKPPVIFTNGARDKWLYKLCCKPEEDKLLTFSAIASQLKKHALAKSWSIIFDGKAIKNAANRWAERNKKPKIPYRQRGRKPR